VCMYDADASDGRVGESEFKRFNSGQT